MRIGFLTQWYEPEPGAAAHPTAVARAFQQRGHEVRVLTGFPNYPTGHIYPDYRGRCRQFEERDEIQITRIPLVPSHDSSALRRAFGLSSFALSAASQIWRLRDVDVLFVYLTPATVGLAARVLRRLSGVPYILYVQDLWPESVTASGFIGNKTIEGWVERRIHSFCRGLYARASSVVAISDTMAFQLRTRGVSDHQSQVVYNWIDESVFHPVGSLAGDTQELDPNSTWIMYAGGIGELQGLGNAVRALAILRDRPEIKLALVGSGVAVEGLQRLASDLNVADRVRFLGPRAMSEMPGLMAESAAQLISLKDLPVFYGTIPSKTQSTMACGLPIVCSAPGDASDMVKRSGSGFAVQPDNSEQLAGAFVKMATAPDAERTAMGEAARRFYEENMSESVGAAKFELILKQAVAESKQ